MAVFVISHSHIVRDILKTTCKLRDLDVTDTCADSAELDCLEPGDVIVLHTGRAIDNVAEQLSHLYGLCNQIRVMLISPESAIDQIRDTFANQVQAIMCEDRPTEALIGALAVINEGYSVVHMPLEALPGTFRQRPLRSRKARNGTSRFGMPSSQITQLSPRENAVLEKLRDGGSNKDIANALGICEATVKVYLRTCYQKIGVKNRTQAAVWATEHLRH
ncbi:MAG: response regulator transcription factor [Pseudomonadota bacterium]